MTLTDHLGELRVRIIRSALAVMLGAVAIVAFYDPVLDFLIRPYISLCSGRELEFCGFNPDAGNPVLIILDPLEGVRTRLSVGTYGGLIVAMPVILWQVWRFIVPALHAKEKRYAVPFILSSIVLFLLGGFLAYITLEPALEFLISFSGDEVGPSFQVSRYIRLVALMVGAFGVGFQFPVLLVFLQLAGVVSPRQLLRGWRYALLAIVVLAAVITPSGDPISLAALAAPMTVLYFLSIALGTILERRKQRQVIAPT